MNKFTYIALKRFRQIFFCCVALSALISLLCVWDILPDRSNELVIGLYAAVIMFVVINIKSLRDSYCELQSYRKYLLVNCCAYGLLLLVNVVVYKLFSRTFYTWLFAITKAARYTSFYLSTSRSAAVFYFLMGIAVFLAPTGLGWIKERKLENEELLARVPGRLEVNPLEHKPNKEAETYEGEKEAQKDALS